MVYHCVKNGSVVKNYEYPAQHENQEKLYQKCLNYIQDC